MSTSSMHGAQNIAPLYTSMPMHANTTTHTTSVAAPYMAPYTRKKEDPVAW